jgi:hypothetical protein
MGAICGKSGKEGPKAVQPKVRLLTHKSGSALRLLSVYLVQVEQIIIFYLVPRMA